MFITNCRCDNKLKFFARRFSCSEDGCHVIFCDAQPLGLQLADMLVSCGAKKIILHFARPPPHMKYKQRYVVFYCRYHTINIFLEIVITEVFLFFF